MTRKIRFTPPAEIRRHLARTVPGVLTPDGSVYDGIRYKWNRTGVTKLLSENLAAQHFATRLEGTARCDVWLRVYDWNLDFVEILNEANGDFVMLWSDDPDYTEFLTRYEHKFHQDCVIAGKTGAQTLEDRAARRAEGLIGAWGDLHTEPFSVAKRAAAVLECAEVSARVPSLQSDPDLTDFKHLLVNTEVGGRDSVAVPSGPSQARRPNKDKKPKPGVGPVPDWGGLEPAPRSNLQMLERDQEEDLDGGVDWDDLEEEDDGSKDGDAEECQGVSE